MWRRERVSDSVRAVAVAETIERIAVLLHAGIAPARAWEYAAAIDDPAASRVHERLRAGATIGEAVAAEGPEWAPVAAAWWIATEVGAPLADTLRATAVAVRDRAAVADDIAVALAEPRSTARLMLWLPAFGVVLGALLGFDTLTVLITNPIGIACLVAGIGLILFARWWTRRLVVRATSFPLAPGAEEELTAIALTGGIGEERARALVAEARADAGMGATATVTDNVLRLSRIAGVPAAGLLRSAASAERQRVRTLARVQSAQLSTRLLLPLGACTLPAFFLLGVAPLILSVITTTTVSW